MKLHVNNHHVYSGLIKLAQSGTYNERSELKQIVEQLNLLLADVEAGKQVIRVAYNEMLEKIVAKFDLIGVDILGEGRHYKNNRLLYRQMVAAYLNQFMNHSQISILMGKERSTISYSCEHAKDLIHIGDQTALHCLEVFKRIIADLNYPSFDH